MEQEFSFDEILKATKENFYLSDSSIYKVFRSAIYTANEVVNDIEKALLNSNFKQIENAAHKLKGASGSIKLDTIYEISSKIEIDAKAQVERDYKKDLELIKDFFSSFESSLEKAENS